MSETQITLIHSAITPAISLSQPESGAQASTVIERFAFELDRAPPAEIRAV